MHYVFSGRKYIYIYIYLLTQIFAENLLARGGAASHFRNRSRGGMDGKKTGDYTQKIHPRNIKWTHIGKNCKFAEELS